MNRTTALCLLAVLIASLVWQPHGSEAAGVAKPNAKDVKNSVVEIFSTLRRPDPTRPWTKQSPTEVTGSGVVIDGNRILTNTTNEQNHYNIFSNYRKIISICRYGRANAWRNERCIF